jgi:hypothetical protein
MVFWLTILIATFSFSAESSKKDLRLEIKRIETSIQIGKMMGADQAYRFSGAVIAKKGYKWEDLASLPEYQNVIANVDSENGKQIKEIIAKWGWPKISDFGEYTAKNIWLLVQHMDTDIEFQKHCLVLMEKLLPFKEVRFVDYGYLYDRVQVNSGKPQRYGTQGECVGKGNWKPKPIEDLKRLSTLRLEAGMPSMEEYTRVLQEMCL